MKLEYYVHVNLNKLFNIYFTTSFGVNQYFYIYYYEHILYTNISFIYVIVFIVDSMHGVL